MISSELLLKIYLAATKEKVIYSPPRKYYNHHLYG